MSCQPWPVRHFPAHQKGDGAADIAKDRLRDIRPRRRPVAGGQGDIDLCNAVEVAYEFHLPPPC